MLWKPWIEMYKCTVGTLVLFFPLCIKFIFLLFKNKGKVKDKSFIWRVLVWEWEIMKGKDRHICCVRNDRKLSCNDHQRYTIYITLYTVYIYIHTHTSITDATLVSMRPYDLLLSILIFVLSYTYIWSLWLSLCFLLIVIKLFPSTNILTIVT